MIFIFVFYKRLHVLRKADAASHANGIKFTGLSPPTDVYDR